MCYYWYLSPLEAAPFLSNLCMTGQILKLNQLGRFKTPQNTMIQNQMKVLQTYNFAL